MTYKIIVRDPSEGTEIYLDNLTKEQAIKEAEERAKDSTKQVYISFVDDEGHGGYLNRDGATCNCPGEPW